ncbi:hypothetical protein [Cetobacterium sp.]|uniref:hypothetical protein n=1 Tax=Cetobacterium sp. TaxID=2071632 RepID=UPI0025D4085B|nr:hypothetical protein [uncultured Cetobacterium sp.]
MNFFKNFFIKKNKNIEIQKKSEIQTECNNDNCGCKSCEHEEEKNGDYLKNICIQIETIPCEPNPYFTGNDESAKFFEEFEIRMTTIYRMYKINSIFLKEYQKVSRKSLSDTRENEKEFSKYSKCYFINNNAFKEIHHMSNLLNIFMIFEVLLKNITKDLAYDKNLDLEEIQNKNMSYLNSYILFIEDKMKIKFSLSDNERNFIGIVRKIRNDYLHDYMTEIPESIEKEIVKIFNLREGKRIVVDEYFIENTCRMFGEIAKRLEKSYWEYKNKTFEK